MSGKIVVQLNREAADVEFEAAAVRREHLRKKFENESNWPFIIKGPVGTLIYGIFMYPRVFFDHIIMENPLYSLTIYQETLVRTLKWTINSPLKTVRKSGSFAESLIKVFRCSEPFRSLKATEAGGIKGYWLGPIKYKQKESEATILYLHGGGYIALSSLLGIRALCYMLKNLRKRHNKHIRVLAIEYPLAPEEPFPIGLDCAERTYKWLVNSGIAGSKNVFLCGDSAGAGLVLALLQKLYPVKSNIALPLGAILLSPWVELSCDSTSFFTNAEFDWISEDYAQFAAEYYIFGKGGNPAREENQISQQPKIDKEVILDWLEKVEDNFDLNELRLSSLNGKKRNSGIRGIRARKRGSKGAKRRSRDKRTIVQSHDPDETFHIERGHPISDEFRLQRSSIEEVLKDKKLHTVNITSITEENPYRDPLISPLHIPHHILAEFPPLFISYGGKEIFRDDIEMFAQKCIESKKAFTSFKINDDDKIDNSLDGQHPDIVVETDEDMVHDYPLFIDIFGKHSKKALDRIIHFIANRIPASKSPHRTKSKDSLKVRKVHPQTQFPIESGKHSSLPVFSVMNKESLSSSRISNTPNDIPNSRKIPLSMLD